jgi:lipopolysaccharide transport system ATP-binding protein
MYGKPSHRLWQTLTMGRKKFYKEFWALRDINFQVKKGESIGIVGRNGAGKSTLLQIITGTLTPTTGNVEVNGRVAALLELGSGFNPEFTGRENVYMNATILGLSHSEIENRYQAIIDFADIGDFIGQPVKTYSSGMLVRLAFAIQVQVHPDILIIDEALAVGDFLFQKRCFGAIEKLIADGVTLLFVSHDQETLRTMTHRALLLNKGNQVVYGNSSDVLLAYRKQLHEEESAYYRAMLTKNINFMPPAGQQLAQSAASARKDIAVTDKTQSLIGRSSKMEFGDGGVNIIRAEALDLDGNSTNVFYVGEPIRIKLTCRCMINTDKLNVAIRIRTKEGHKVYSWGTLNQDMQILAGQRDGDIFWKRRFQPGDELNVLFECGHCPLGPNFYEVQVAVSHEEMPDYTAQRMLHWVDEAVFFQTLMREKEYFFGGMFDMRMEASW